MSEVWPSKLSQICKLLDTPKDCCFHFWWTWISLQVLLSEIFNMAEGEGRVLMILKLKTPRSWRDCRYRLFSLYSANDKQNDREIAHSRTWFIQGVCTTLDTPPLLNSEYLLWLFWLLSCLTSDDSENTLWWKRQKESPTSNQPKEPISMETISKCQRELDSLTY